MYYGYYANSEIVLTVRQPMIPEFVNPNLRHISFNLFSYLFFLRFRNDFTHLVTYKINKRIFKKFSTYTKKSFKHGAVNI